MQVSPYNRYTITASGVSPRAFPEQPGVLVTADSDEHDDEGHSIESAEIRIAQMQKRMKKIVSIRKELSVPKQYGQKKAEISLIGWGSSYGALREAVDCFNKKGIQANMFHLEELWPFPVEAVSDFLINAKTTYVVESNMGGQLSKLISAETGKKTTGNVLRFDGRPLTPAFIIREVEKGGVHHGDIR